MQEELQTLVQHEDQRIGSRVKQVLPLASDLLEAAIAGMQDLDGGVPAGRPGRRGIPDVRELGELDWRRVLERFGAPADPLTLKVIHDLSQALNGPHPGSGPSTAEICAALDAMRVQINDLAGADPDALPVAAVARMLMIIAELARAVAVGLLVAAASAASAGTDVVSALLPAAVAAIVSGLCDQLGKAVGSAARTLTPSEFLTREGEELARMLNDLAGFADRYSTSPDQDRNDALARETATVAVITSIHAKNLARIVSWTSADAYADILDGIRKKLISATGMAAATNADRHDLAGWLRDAAGQLSSWAIPPDLELCRTVPDQPSTPYQAGTEVQAPVRPAPATAGLNPGGGGQTAQPAEHAPDFGVSSADRPAAAVPRSANGPATASHESAPAAAIAEPSAGAGCHDGVKTPLELENETAGESGRRPRGRIRTTSATGRSGTGEIRTAEGATTPGEALRQMLDEVQALTDERYAKSAPAVEPIEIRKSLNVLE